MDKFSWLVKPLVVGAACGLLVLLLFFAAPYVLNVENKASGDLAADLRLLHNQVDSLDKDIHQDLDLLKQQVAGLLNDKPVVPPVTPTPAGPNMEWYVDRNNSAIEYYGYVVQEKNAEGEMVDVLYYTKYSINGVVMSGAGPNGMHKTTNFRRKV
jgi:hypothetical protein